MFWVSDVSGLISKHIDISSIAIAKFIAVHPVQIKKFRIHKPTLRSKKLSNCFK